MYKALRIAELVFELVRGLEKKHVNPIGETRIQKLMYLVERKTGDNFGYAMYHYGPHSGDVAYGLRLAGAVDWLDIKWCENKGYCISTKIEKLPLTFSLPDRDTNAVRSVVERYGDFSVRDLIMVTTAFYSKSVFGMDDVEIVNVIVSMNPNISREKVEEILARASTLMGVEYELEGQISQRE